MEKGKIKLKKPFRAVRVEGGEIVGRNEIW